MHLTQENKAFKHCVRDQTRNKRDLEFLLQRVHAKSLQSCPTLYNPMDCSLPGSSVRGILQARVLEWVAMPSSSESSPPRDQTTSSVAPALQTDSLSLSHHGSQFLSHLATNELCGSESEKDNNFFWVSHLQNEVLFFYEKNATGIFMRITLNLQISLVEILIILTLSMSTKCLSFSVFSFFHHCLIVFSVQVFHILIKFIPMYFILFDGIVNEIVFLISLSDRA